MHQLFEIPGDPFIARILTSIFLIGIEAGVFVLALLIVRNYVKPTSGGNRALGIIVGAVLGIIAATTYSSTYQNMFNAEPKIVSIFLLLAVLGNIAISDFIFKPKP